MEYLSKQCMYPVKYYLRWVFNILYKANLGVLSFKKQIYVFKETYLPFVNQYWCINNPVVIGPYVSIF